MFLQCHFSFEFVLSPNDITASPLFVMQSLIAAFSSAIFRSKSYCPLMTLLRHPFLYVRFNCYFLQCYFSFQFLLSPNVITAPPFFCKVQVLFSPELFSFQILLSPNDITAPPIFYVRFTCCVSPVHFSFQMLLSLVTLLRHSFFM